MTTNERLYATLSDDDLRTKRHKELRKVGKTLVMSWLRTHPNFWLKANQMFSAITTSSIQQYNSPRQAKALHSSDQPPQIAENDSNASSNPQLDMQLFDQQVVRYQGRENCFERAFPTLVLHSQGYTWAFSALIEVNKCSCSLYIFYLHLLALSDIAECKLESMNCSAMQYFMNCV